MRLIRILAMFATMLAFWVVLSGQLNPVFLGMGVISAAVSAWFGARLVEATIGHADKHPSVNVFWLAIYVFWLVGRMVVGAFQVARIVVDSRHPPRPGIMKFRTQLSSPAARALLANSITLVPGTITLDVIDDELTVHSFTPSSVDDLADAQMQNRIAAIFREPAQPVPDLEWEFGQAAPRDGDPESHEGFHRDGRPSQ